MPHSRGSVRSPSVRAGWAAVASIASWPRSVHRSAHERGWARYLSCYTILCPLLDESAGMSEQNRRSLIDGANGCEAAGAFGEAADRFDLRGHGAWSKAETTQLTRRRAADRLSVSPSASWSKLRQRRSIEAKHRHRFVRRAGPPILPGCWNICMPTFVKRARSSRKSWVLHLRMRSARRHGPCGSSQRSTIRERQLIECTLFGCLQLQGSNAACGRGASMGVVKLSGVTIS
jgi:hypothetical protein